MELIALNIGYDMGILSQRIFTMLVIMALITTIMTGPLVNFFGKTQTITGTRSGPWIDGLRPGAQMRRG
jgi:Kef-type K+ transport system membrane component KefB